MSPELTGSLAANCSSVKCCILKVDSQLTKSSYQNKLANGCTNSPSKRCGGEDRERKCRMPRLSLVIAIKSIQSISNGLFPSDGPCLIRVRAGGSLHAWPRPFILPFPLVCLFFYCFSSAKLAFVRHLIELCSILKQ